MKKIFKWLFYALAALAFLLISLVAPIDRTALREQDYFHGMMARLDTLDPIEISPTEKLKAGWGKYNITPLHKMPMAGYKPRSSFDAVHDSLYARILAVDNGGMQAFIISVDLLIFPPSLKAKIERDVKLFFSSQSLVSDSALTYLSLAQA